MRVAWCMLLLSGCSARVLELPLPAGFDRGTELLFVTGHTGIPELYARDLSVEQFTIPGKFVDDPLALEAWQIEASLAQLGLEPGRVALAKSGEEGAFLFQPARIGVGTISGDDFSGWIERSEPSPAALAVRFAGTPADCLSKGGCFVDGPLCTVPCEPVAPRSPRAPEEVLAEGCPLGWTGEPSDQFPETCASWVSYCPIGLLSESTGACATVDDDCPPWPVVAAGAVYVSSSSMGGDGTMSLPYATITEALASLGPTGGVIALAPGDYAEEVLLGAEVAVIGACAPKTRLLRAIEVRGGHAVTLSSVSIAAEVLVVGSTLAIDRSFVFSTTVSASGGASVLLTQVAGDETAVRATDAGTKVSIEESTFRGPRSGMSASVGALLKTRAVWMTDTAGVQVDSFRTRAELRQMVWRGGAAAVTANRCSEVLVERALIFGTAAGIQLFGADAEVYELDVRYPEGFGLNLEAPAPACDLSAMVADFYRVKITGAVNSAVQVLDTNFRGYDLDLRDSRPVYLVGYEPKYGRGLNVQENGEIFVTRMRSTGHRRHAFRASGARFEMQDIQLSDVVRGSLGDLTGCPGGTVADGASIACASVGSIERFLVEGTECGLSIIDSELDLKDGVLREVSAGLCGDLLAPARMSNVRIEGRAFAGDGGT